MKKVLRFLLCCAISFAVVYLSGYGNLMNDLSDSLVAVTFFGAVIVLSILVFLLLEMYLSFKNKIGELSNRIEELEKNKQTDQ